MSEDTKVFDELVRENYLKETKKNIIINRLSFLSLKQVEIQKEMYELRNELNNL